uniref:WW domain binding protein 11 n=1 Tax=Saimiri boliviensis boliviensis TaxID=39432 RepID=A0A2K6UXF4_SAIBB
MGRRSTSSTKWKIMNPTDQARKENKNQHMTVRAAKLDEMEFNPVQQPQLNEKILKGKRKKLCETSEHIHKEPRKLEVEYEQKRAQLSQYFDAVKNAQHVEVESIPLPDMPHAPSNILILDIPLLGAQPSSILKKTSAYGPPFRAVSILPLLGHGVPQLPPGRKPPGPPPVHLLLQSCRFGFILDLPPHMLCSPELAQQGYDDDVSSTSEDDGYSEGMDQDNTDDSDTGKSDGESEGDEFVHRNDGETDNNEEKKSDLSVRFADMPGKSRKKKKNMKELTPLQAMMLRMAGQEIPEEGREVEEFSEDDDEDDSDDSEAEKQSQKQHKAESYSDAAGSPAVCSSFSDTSTSHARTTISFTTTCSTITASWSTSRSSSIPETTWNARTLRAFTPTFTSRTTTRPTPWPSPRSTSRSVSWSPSLGTPTKHDVPTFGASPWTCSSLAEPWGFKYPTQLDSSTQGG